MPWLLIISFVLLLFYVFRICGFYSAWTKAPSFIPNPPVRNIPVVIIPFHNEAERLPFLLESLLSQSVKDFNVLLVDDYSKDTSRAVAEKLCAEHKQFQLLVNQGPAGKKHALMTGIREAKSDLIVISDADCRYPSDWLMHFASFFQENPHAKLVSSGVILEPFPAFRDKYQALEFSSLVASGAASFLQNNPLMCNGANLAFPKSLFLEAFESIHPEVNTGDDMFLMAYAKKKYPGELYFLKNPDAFVFTSPSGSWRKLLNQRIRWASKSTLYRDFSLVFLSFLVFFIHLLFPILLILGFSDPVYLLAAAGLFCVKSIPDYIFLRSFLEFTGQDKLLKIFIPSQLINFIFIPVSAFLGILRPPVRSSNK